MIHDPGRYLLLVFDRSEKFSMCCNPLTSGLTISLFLISDALPGVEIVLFVSDYSKLQ